MSDKPKTALITGSGQNIDAPLLFILRSKGLTS